MPCMYEKPCIEHGQGTTVCAGATFAGLLARRLPSEGDTQRALVGGAEPGAAACIEHEQGSEGGACAMFAVGATSLQ